MDMEYFYTNRVAQQRIAVERSANANRTFGLLTIYFRDMDLKHKIKSVRTFVIRQLKNKGDKLILLASICFHPILEL